MLVRRENGDSAATALRRAGQHLQPSNSKIWKKNFIENQFIDNYQ